MPRSPIALALALALAFLASCGQQPDPPTQAGQQAVRSKPAESAGPAQSVDSEATTPAAEPQEAATPPSDAFFVGRWASEEANCRDAWVITEQGLRTPGHVVCQFRQVTRTPRGAEADATCTAEGPPQQWKLQFSYAQSARALLIEDGPFADIGLIRCDGPVDRPVSPPPPGSPGGLPDDRTPVSEAPFTSTSAQGAANVLQTYYALLAAGRYDEAWRLWSQSGQASGMSAEAFARSFAQYESYNANIGKPGRIEGAAGSLYVSVPVQIYARRQSGEDVHRIGQATLRRSNDVPGSTPEQRSWRIYRIELQPAPDGGPR